MRILLPFKVSAAAALLALQLAGWYGRWMYKYEEMARRGAAGALVIHENAPAAYGWPTVVNSNVSRCSTAAGGSRFRDAKAAARTREFQPVDVAGVLPGNTHPDEWLLYTAHWDHLGLGPPDATGDTIYNGAVDNAAGVAQVLEIARAFASSRRPARSIAKDRRYTPDNRAEAGPFYRSDHFPLAKPGVPAISYKSGEDLMEGGTAAGKAWASRTIATSTTSQVTRSMQRPGGRMALPPVRHCFTRWGGDSPTPASGRGNRTLSSGLCGRPL